MGQGVVVEKTGNMGEGEMDKGKGAGVFVLGQWTASGQRGDRRGTQENGGL